MKLLFLTNMPSYHQIELADALQDLLGVGNFCMGIYAPISSERLQMNWQDSYQADYLFRYSESVGARDHIHQWIQSADVVIQGRFPIRHLRKRIKAGGLTYAYQERIWKKGFSIPRFIRRLPHLVKNYWSVNKSNYHLLAAGAYAGNDLVSLGIFKNRCWKFGYFVNAKSHTHKPGGSALSIVWCGRMIDCKQPQKALEIALGLKKSGINFHLTMIGGGELSDQVESDIRRLHIHEHVSLAGWQSIESVNSLMADADIMLMTSDQRDGWGLVINEAINNRCFVVANASVGAANWLLKDGETGLVYRDEDLPLSINKLVSLCQQRESLQQMADLAYENLSTIWSTKTAASRIVRLSAALLEGASGHHKALTLFKSGPGSPA